MWAKPERLALERPAKLGRKGQGEDGSRGRSVSALVGPAAQVAGQPSLENPCEVSPRSLLHLAPARCFQKRGPRWLRGRGPPARAAHAEPADPTQGMVARDILHPRREHYPLLLRPRPRGNSRRERSKLRASRHGSVGRNGSEALAQGSTVFPNKLRALRHRDGLFPFNGRRAWPGIVARAVKIEVVGRAERFRRWVGFVLRRDDVPLRVVEVAEPKKLWPRARFGRRRFLPRRQFGERNGVPQDSSPKGTVRRVPHRKHVLLKRVAL